MAKDFLRKAGTFVDTMGEDHHHHRGGRHGPRHGHHGHHSHESHDSHDDHHGHHGHHDHHSRGKKEWGFCGERSKWAEKRAIIVRKPQEVLVGEPGKIIFVEVEVQNQTKWPWKYGCFVGMAESIIPEGVYFIIKDFPIDQEVRGMQTIKLSIPIEIPANFQEGIDFSDQVYDVPLSLFGPKHNPFGQQFTVKIQVQDGQSELNLFKAAITLSEAGMGTFDECVDALRKCNNDENAALQILVEKKEEATLYE